MTPSHALSRRLALVRATDAALGLLAACGFGAAAAVALGGAWTGLAAAGAVAALALSRATRLDAARRIERRDPALSGAVTAFAEGGGGRLRDALAGWVLERRPRGSYGRSALLVALSLAAAGLAVLARSAPRATINPAPERAAAPAPAPAPPRITVKVTPPAYARRPATRHEGTSRPVPALRGSTADVVIETSRASIDLAEEGKEPRPLAAEGGRARWSTALERSTAVRLAGDLVLVFDVVPDAAPEVELALPAEDRTVTKAPGPFDVKALARDDLGLTSLALHYTLAHGHGEGMTFRSGRIEGPRTPGAQAVMSARLDPAALGLGSGDTLVMWAEATDGNAVDGPSRTASAVRILRFEEDLARIEMKSSAPAVRPHNGPLSQREILARTLRLLEQRLPKEAERERSLDLGEEQGRLRSAFGFFLRAEDGNAVELDMEEKEAGELGSDRARGLLARAVSAMWASEAELSAGTPRGSLPHQRLAVNLLDQVFGGERYALRALAPPRAPVDEARRLKGDAKGLAPRAAPEAPEGRRAQAAPLAAVARRLLLASEGLLDAPTRALADELWALPELSGSSGFSGLSRSALAAPLYAAATPADRARAARTAAEALIRLLGPDPPARPAAAPSEAAIFSRLGSR